MKTNNLIKTGVVVIFTSGLMGGRLCAAPSPQWLHDQGTIEHIDPYYETFTMLDNRQAVLGLEYDHHTRFYNENGVPITTRDLKPGERVGVTYQKEGDRLVPKAVRVLSEPSQ